MPNAWDRQDAEPNMWYDRFVRHYLSKGSGRSVLESYNLWREQAGKSRTTKTATAWQNNADKWHWKQRAEAYDAHLREKDAAIWEQRRLELQQRDWDVAHKLTEKVMAMLNFPVSEQHIEQDGKSVTIYPAKWTQRDAAQIAKTASEMARLAAGLVTDHKQSDTRDVGEQAATLEEWKAARAARDAQRDQMLGDFEET